MARRAATTGSGGSKWMQIAVVVIAIAAAGTWNYQRNRANEHRTLSQRPFMTYDREALEQLVEAYESDLVTEKRRSQGRADARAIARDTELLGDAVAEFDRVSRVAKARRAATGSIAQQEARLAQVQAELARRKPGYDLLLHAQRLTGISLTN